MLMILEVGQGDQERTEGVGKEWYLIEGSFVIISRLTIEWHHACPL